jgi:hypothetical protein
LVALALAVAGSAAAVARPTAATPASIKPAVLRRKNMVPLQKITDEA